jgi:predicted ester cyclase
MDPNTHLLEQIVASFNGRNWEEYGRVFDEALVVHAPGLTSTGRDARVKWVQDLIAGFPDGHIALMRVFGHGHWLCAELTFDGTHTGPLKTGPGVVPPTGRRLQFPYCLVLRVKNGRVAELHEYFDQMELVTQLDLLAHA